MRIILVVALIGLFTVNAFASTESSQETALPDVVEEATPVATEEVCFRGMNKEEFTASLVEEFGENNYNVKFHDGNWIAQWSSNGNTHVLRWTQENEVYGLLGMRQREIEVMSVTGTGYTIKHVYDDKGELLREETTESIEGAASSAYNGEAEKTLTNPKASLSGVAVPIFIAIAIIFVIAVIAGGKRKTVSGEATISTELEGPKPSKISQIFGKKNPGTSSSGAGSVLSGDAYQSDK